MTKKDYFIECIQEAMSDHRLLHIDLPDDVIEVIAEHVESAVEHMDLAFPRPSGPSPAEIEARTLRAALSREQSKVVCPECRGNGIEVGSGPVHSSVSQCWKCRGEGKALP